MMIYILSVYMDLWGRFNETELPSKEHFYSKLNEEDISNEDYEKAKQILKKKQIKNLGEYHDFILLVMFSC